MDVLTKRIAVKTGRVTKKKAPAAPKIKPEPLLEEEEEGMQGLVEEELEGGDEVVDEIEEV